MTVGRRSMPIRKTNPSGMGVCRDWLNCWKQLSAAVSCVRAHTRSNELSGIFCVSGDPQTAKYDYPLSVPFAQVGPRKWRRRLVLYWGSKTSSLLPDSQTHGTVCVGLSESSRSELKRSSTKVLKSAPVVRSVPCRSAIQAQACFEAAEPAVGCTSIVECVVRGCCRGRDIGGSRRRSIPSWSRDGRRRSDGSPESPQT